MKKRLVIFGNGDIAEMAHYNFSTFTDYEVVAFTVDSQFIGDGRFCGLPVVAFEDVAALYPPDDFEMFVAIGYAKVNAIRQAKFLAAKALGYRLASFVSPHSIVHGHVAIGENCLIMENNVIQPFAVIGDNVTIWGFCGIGHHTVIGDHCFMASLDVISGRVTIGRRCFIGLQCAVRDHLTIGDDCVLGAGSIILKDAAPGGVYGGRSTPRSKVPSSRLARI